MLKKISLIIVDDHSIVVEGLRAILHDQQDINIAEHFCDGSSTLNYLKNNSVDVILLDISLPDINGIDLCKQIKKEYRDTKIIGLSTFNDRSMILRMLQNGAMGYLLKNIHTDELVNAIKSVYQGQIFLGDEVQKLLSDYPLNDTEEIPILTRRELQILKYIANGSTTSEIGHFLFISPLTVETHRRNLMYKFNVNNAPSLIRKAMDYKLI